MIYMALKLRDETESVLFLAYFFRRNIYICCFSLDENDNVYIVTEIPSRNGNDQAQYKLLTFDVNGNAVAERSLGIVEKLMYPQMTVTHDGKLVIYCWRIKGMYICDSIVKMAKETTNFLCH